jgi:hypothetical protein
MLLELVLEESDPDVRPSGKDSTRKKERVRRAVGEVAPPTGGRAHTKHPVCT